MLTSSLYERGRKVSMLPMVLSFFILMPGQPETLLKGVPHIQQNPELDRGCEVTSLAMLLQYAGVKVDKITLAEEITKEPFWDGEYRGNPNRGFVGNIYTFEKSGYGVYHQPIFALAKQYLPVQAINLTGRPVKDLYEMIDAGSPVWVITNATFSPLPKTSFRTWNTKNGKVKITYSEHSVVITGYDEQNVYINDPLYHEANRKVDRESFEKAWVQMGSQAISYLPEHTKHFFDTRDHSAKLAIDYVFEKGYMNGYSDFYFGPDDKVTRAHLASVLTKLLPEDMLDKVTSTKFQDTNGHWAEKQIMKIASVGYMEGYGDEFKPNEVVTRTQMAVIIDEILGLQVALEIPFKDVRPTHWAYEEIQRVSTVGIMPRTSIFFYPNRGLTRAELAVILREMDKFGRFN